MKKVIESSQSSIKTFRKQMAWTTVLLLVIVIALCPLFVYVSSWFMMPVVVLCFSWSFYLNSFVFHRENRKMKLIIDKDFNTIREFSYSIFLEEFERACIVKKFLNEEFSQGFFEKRGGYGTLIIKFQNEDMKNDYVSIGKISEEDYKILSKELEEILKLK